MALPKALLLLVLQLSLLLSCISGPVTHAGVEHRYPPPPAPASHHHPPAPAPAPHHHHHHHHPQPPHHHHHPPAPAPAPHHYPPAPAPHHHHPHPPTPVPSHAPVKPPVYPKPPVHSPPTSPPRPLPVRKLLAIRGVVFCKSCKLKGVDTLTGAKPLAKAVVKLQCNNTKQGLVETTETDKNGFFVFRPLKVTTMAFHKCKVFIVSSKTCSVLTNLHGGVSGAVLIPSMPPVAASLFQYFNVGPFAFEPSKKCY